MRRILFPLAAAFMTTVLAACSLSDAIPGESALRAGAAPAAAEDVSATQGLGDRLFGAAESAEVREARQDMAVASYMYLLSDRVARFDPQIADQALGRMQTLRGTLAGRDLAQEQVFTETMLGEVTIELAAIAVDTGLERASSFAGLFVGGPNISGLLLRGRVAARQAFFVDLLLTDIRRGVVKMNGDPAFVAVVKARAALLMCDSENRVRAIVQAPPLVCGPAEEV